MVLTALIVFILMLVVSSIKNKEIPDCISRCYYIIGSWFTVGMFIIAFLMLPSSLDAMDNIFSFLMCGCIAFVGAAPKYLDIDERKIHFTSACISAICSIIFVSCINPICLLGCSISLLSWVDTKRKLLWCELGCFISVFLVLLI